MTMLYVATEDALSEAVADRLVSEVNQGLEISVRMGRKGCGYLRNKFSELVRLANHIPVFLLTDLDLTDCPPTLIHAWSGTAQLPDNMLFRVAVREIEAWLLADRPGFSEFFNIPLIKLPDDPETIEDPKQFLLSLVRRYSKREAKAAILPERGSRAKIGFGYNQMLSLFVERHWSLQRALESSESLRRTHQRLSELSAGAEV